MSSLLDRAAGSLANSDYESASAHERLDTRQTPAHNAQYVQRVIHKRAIAGLLGAQRGVCRIQNGLSPDVTDRQHQTRPRRLSLEELFTAKAADQRFGVHRI
jgi:hypothetical protein